MITCDTMDTAACVRETLALVESAAKFVRITAPDGKGRSEPPTYRR